MPRPVAVCFASAVCFMFLMCLLAVRKPGSKLTNLATQNIIQPGMILALNASYQVLDIHFPFIDDRSDPTIKRATLPLENAK